MAHLDPKRRMNPPILDGKLDVKHLIDGYYNAYNAARLREACHLFTQMANEGATIGLTLSGALTPAGLGPIIVPLIRAGFVDYIASTGANLYHDLHFALGCHLYRSTAAVASGASDVELRKQGIVRVYDVLFEQDVLLKTDEWLYHALSQEEFRKSMASSELHHRLGRYALEAARKHGNEPGVLATCYEYDVPVYTPSPGDSTLGMNIAALWTDDPDSAPSVLPAKDVTETAAIIVDTKRSGRPSSVVILGGGAPKNFVLQTEPQLQEVLGIEEKGHDYFIQITDARPDTGGLSGATPSEAVSWGKVDPEQLPNSVVCYADSTLIVPLMATYILSSATPRQPRRLYTRLPELVENLRALYRETDMYKQRCSGHG